MYKMANLVISTFKQELKRWQSHGSTCSQDATIGSTRHWRASGVCWLLAEWRRVAQSISAFEGLAPDTDMHCSSIRCFGDISKSSQARGV